MVRTGHHKLTRSPKNGLIDELEYSEELIHPKVYTHTDTHTRTYTHTYAHAHTLTCLHTHIAVETSPFLQAGQLQTADFLNKALDITVSFYKGSWSISRGSLIFLLGFPEAK